MITRQSSPQQRVDSLMALSDAVYPALAERVPGGIRARQIVRLGIHVVADRLHDTTIGNTTKRLARAGLAYHGTLIDQLGRSYDYASQPLAYKPFQKYSQSFDRLPVTGATPARPQDLTQLANDYSDVVRATRLKDDTPETNATHVAHLSALALPYAAELYPELDQNKIALYCLIHDILEKYTKDIPTLAISNDAYLQKQANEAAALQQFELDYGEQWPELVAVVEAYESLEDPEARFVKTFDKLDPSFTHFINRGTQLIETYDIQSRSEFFAETAKTTVRMVAYSSEFPELMDDRDQLLLRVADHIDWPLGS